MIHCDPEWSVWSRGGSWFQVEDGSTELHGNGGCHGSIPCWWFGSETQGTGESGLRMQMGWILLGEPCLTWQDVSKLSPKLGWATLNFCFNHWPHISPLVSTRMQRCGHSCLRKCIRLLGQIGRHGMAVPHNDYFYRLGWNQGWRSREKASPIPRRCSLSYNLVKSRVFSKWMARECYPFGQSNLRLQDSESELGRCVWKSVMLAWYWTTWVGTCDGGSRAENESN